MSATFVPPLSLEGIAHSSERLTAEALSALSSGWVVMHSYPWLRSTRDAERAPLREGEADFILLHRRWGFLLVEVKGGPVELRGRVWRRGGNEIRDPFDQARRSRHTLLDAIQERTRGAVHRGMFTHGDVVILPHHTWTGDLPYNTSRDTLIDAHGLSELEERLIGASRSYGEHPELPEATFTAFVSALLPSFRLVRCAAADIRDESARFLQLTEQQNALLVGLLATPRVCVDGVAGSGKTLLAAEYAIRLAEDGLSVLLLCYNRHLAAWLDERLTDEPRLSSALGRVDSASFHSFAVTTATRARVDFDIPSAQPAQQEFWQNEAAMVLSQALSLLEGTDAEVRYDAVVVDEGQDFERDWWVPIDDLCGGPDGRLYVFLDLHQRLREGTGEPATSFDARLRLDVNCRNTRAVAEASNHLLSLPTRVLPTSPAGEPPLIRRAHTPEAVRGLVQQQLHALLADGIAPSQVALIGPASWRNGPLRGLVQVDDVALTDDAAAWRRGEGVLVTTAKAFKGLEADVVVIYDVASFGRLFNERDLYVAATRAKHRLFVCAPPGAARAAMEAAIAAGGRDAV